MAALVAALAGRRERDDLIDLTMTGSDFFQPARRTVTPVPRPGRWAETIKSSTDQAEPGDADHDQIDGDDVIEQARHEQDQNSGQQGDERLDMGDGNHGGLLEAFGQRTVLRKTNYAKIIGALPLNDFAPDWFTPWR
jgi:hypothetical protein